MKPLAQPRVAERERVWAVMPGDGDACGVESQANRQTGRLAAARRSARGPD